MPNKPHREVYTIIASTGAEKKDRWVRIGATFVNKDGSETVLLDALPTNGKLQLRTPKPKDTPETLKFQYKATLDLGPTFL